MKVIFVQNADTLWSESCLNMNRQFWNMKKIANEKNYKAIEFNSKVESWYSKWRSVKIC